MVWKKRKSDHSTAFAAVRTWSSLREQSGFASRTHRAVIMANGTWKPQSHWAAVQIALKVAIIQGMKGLRTTLHRLEFNLETATVMRSQLRPVWSPKHDTQKQPVLMSQHNQNWTQVCYQIIHLKNVEGSPVRMNWNISEEPSERNLVLKAFLFMII